MKRLVVSAVTAIGLLSPSLTSAQGVCPEGTVSQLTQRATVERVERFASRMRSMLCSERSETRSEARSLGVEIPGFLDVNGSGSEGSSRRSRFCSLDEREVAAQLDLFQHMEDTSNSLAALRACIEANQPYAILATSEDLTHSIVEIGDRSGGDFQTLQIRAIEPRNLVTCTLGGQDVVGFDFSEEYERARTVIMTCERASVSGDLNITISTNWGTFNNLVIDGTKTISSRQVSPSFERGSTTPSSWIDLECPPNFEPVANSLQCILLSERLNSHPSHSFHTVAEQPSRCIFANIHEETFEGAAVLTCQRTSTGSETE